MSVSDKPTLRTPLYTCHVAAGARLVDFAGWEMPVNYGSQIEEHHAVRQSAGMFDVSHMLSIDLTGAGATPYLRALLANDVSKLQSPGKALYSCMLNEAGGVIDDLIVYRFSDAEYRLVVNAGTADGDVAWMRQRAAATGANITLSPRRDLAMIAVQGPEALSRAARAILELNTARADLAPFQAARLGDLFIGRTGYTGEDGIEAAIPAERVAQVWEALVAAGVKPCGLGARDTLRLEAGMNLYGQDMDASTSPLDAGLGWTIDLKDPERDFMGKSALLAHGDAKAFVGLVLEDKGVLRAHMRVTSTRGDGETTSGSFSPTLQKSIAFARLPHGTAAGEPVQVDMRGRLVQARTVKLPFVRKGKALI